MYVQKNLAGNASGSLTRGNASGSLTRGKASGSPTGGNTSAHTHRSGGRSSASRPGRPTSRGGFRGGQGARDPSRPAGRGGYSSAPRRSNKRGGSAGIDPARFINKAVVVQEAERFVPVHAFADFAISDHLKRNVIEKGYVHPTPVQDEAIPAVLAGRDVVGIANTGTGKTAAFLIPLIDKVLRNPKEQVLILVPTRELALQIDAEFKAFTRGVRVFSVCCVGGAPVGPQLRALSYRNEFIIGTPGRVKDFMERGKIRTREFTTVVLDEADRMLDMGFINDMRFIMQDMPKQRHTLFFSATLSPEIEKLIHDFLNNPVHVRVKTRETAASIEQDVVRVTREGKLDALHDLLTRPEFKKVLIFGRTKHGVEKLGRMLVQRGFAADSIHGDKNHSQRQRALKKFKENGIQVLVATDVAARGLDIPDVSHVINYDIPQSYEDYVHRIGRTGRGSKGGVALTFVE